MAKKATAEPSGPAPNASLASQRDMLIRTAQLSGGLTGRQIMLFQKDAIKGASKFLHSKAGVSLSSASFASDPVDALHEGNYSCPNLGVVVATMDPDQHRAATLSAFDDGIIMSVPESLIYLTNGLNFPQFPIPPVAAPPATSLDYIRGLYDGFAYLTSGGFAGLPIASATAPARSFGPPAGAFAPSSAYQAPRFAESFGMSPQFSPAAVVQSAGSSSLATWGLQATGVLGSPYTGAGVKVMVLDSGIDLNHPDFQGRIEDVFDTTGEGIQDRLGHGTHCAGTVCGPMSPAGGRPRYGVAPGAMLYVGKIFKGNMSMTGDVIASLEWAIDQGVRIVSMSFGLHPGSQDQARPAYIQIGNRCLSKDMILVAAAGNNSRRDQGVVNECNSPANTRAIMAVGAVDPNLQVAPFSNGSGNPNLMGSDIDIVGPGMYVYSSASSTANADAPAGGQVPNYQADSTGLCSLHGTSQATPHVAGIAALYCEANPDLSAGKIMDDLLLKSAQRLSADSRDVGWGLVQAPR